MTGDLHTHTSASFDSSISFDERVELAEENDITCIALTDHNVVHPRLRKREEAFGDVNIITGIEICAFGKHGKLDILGYFIDPETIREKLRGEHRPRYRHAIRWIHDAGGVAVLAHPGRYSEFDEVVELLVDMRIDGLECQYPYRSSSKDKMLKAEELADIHDLVKTGGSDCHGPERNNMGLVNVSDDVVEELRNVSENYR